MTGETGSYSSDVAFTPTVKEVQARKGSRDGYRRMEERGGWETRITPDLAGFIADRPAPSSPPQTARVSPISSIAAGRPAFSR